MECPICGSDDVEILNSKQKSTKKKFTEELLLRCNDCQHVFRDTFSAKKPKPYRIIISEQDQVRLKLPVLKLMQKGLKKH